MFSLIVLIILSVALLALYLLVRGTNTPSARYFRLTLIAALLWTVSILLTERDIDPSRVLMWSRFSFVFAAFMSVALVPFALKFGKEATNRNLPKYMVYMGYAVSATGLFFAGVSIATPLVLRSVNNLVSTFGPLQPIYGAFLLLSFVYIGATLIMSRRKARGAVLEQLNMMVLGILVSATLAILTNLIIPFLGLGEIRLLGPFSLIFFLGATTYAIAAHHLFDIRLVIKRTVIFAALVAFSFIVYAASILLISRIFQRDAVSILSFGTNLIAVLIIGFSLDPLRKWLSDRTDKWLFKKEYEQQVVIKDLSTRLNDVIAMDEALEIVMQSIVRVLHLKHAATYVFQPGENGTFAIKQIKQVGYSGSARLILEDRDFTVPYFTEHAGILLLRDMELELEREKELLDKKKEPKQDSAFIRTHAVKQAVYKKLHSLDVAVAVPLHLNNSPIGLILLSDKLSGEGYHPQDLALLELVGGQAVSSIQKAKLYEGDQMKSEFVSIASHELLTPISAMEGYLSMILDEGIGKVDPQARDYLGKVYTSAKRLSLLIKDLLSVSRIESGKMKIEPQQLDMHKMITDTLDQLHFVAKDKNLELEYEQPKSPYPPVWADPDRTMQVMVNLVSNAIKYTKQGVITITVDIDKHMGFMKTSVSDTGLGMSKSAQQHLFTRFYRVDTPETTGIMGTGLGLYITKSIVEKMGGTITCKSTEGKGSTFSFTLPLFKVERSTLE